MHIPTGPIPIGPIPIGLIPTGPIPMGPIPIGPVPIEPIPIGPVPMGPSPIGPVPSEPIPNRPKRLLETVASHVCIRFGRTLNGASWLLCGSLCRQCYTCYARAKEYSHSTKWTFHSTCGFVRLELVEVEQAFASSQPLGVC